MTKVRFVVATREDNAAFYTKTAIGKSLALIKSPLLEIRLFPKNIEGLPKVYNIAIEESRTDPATLIFAHDDIYLTDFFWAGQIKTALTHFKIVGVVGNKRRLSGQPSWMFVNDAFVQDHSSHFSGVVGHGRTFPPEKLTIYGSPCQEVKLLDGLLLITKSETLIDSGLRFDEQFKFHFYDMDFCRQAERLKISMGTWAISVIHESGGSFQSNAWKAAYLQYLKKWRD